ncbi:hypothetical protein CEXT_179641 [Caerostris extrusa]|uniref:Uncharacterized protein n=1 Tax=Caerostris extrusa TaxID=172846 RepID=A0AAV4XUU7_CAEEX|nr:hypothetical protein CEXT_179641 [Caerostris extrusa]
MEKEKLLGVPSLLGFLPAWMVGRKTYDQSGKSVRNGAQKHTFVSDRRRKNCCGANKKNRESEELVLCGWDQGWAKGWMMVSPGGSWNA